ncbi:DUF4419 domain-containing protein [Streptomyces sp. NPDC051940]|uniref:DUF4419 domain-containing protein n=1 Tax=Streptomyces sp. NPDC051940 TaxID=3155675 RepID=UPI003417D9CF
MVTFAVDDVTPAAEPLPTRPLREVTPDALAIGGDPALPVLEPNGVHPLLAATGLAFAGHRPLVLSPDAVWLTILQGVAQHVRLHAEELRPLLVSHAGRERLEVVVPGGMPVDADSWRDFVESVDKLLTTESAAARLFACDFSTSTDVERTAGRVVALDAYASYFAVWMRFVCGIPSITLIGTAEDWLTIRARVDAIAETFRLETWCRSLAPIAEQFARAAAGDVDTAFWRRIYSPIDAYGGRVVTGWAARFYPYLRDAGVFGRPNPLLELPLGEPRDVAPDSRGFYRGPGVRSDDVPATLSRVVVNVNDRVAGDNRAVALHAGLVGVTQDEDGALRPVAGWHLTAAAVEIDDVLDRIVRDHATTPPLQTRSPHGGSAEAMAVYRRIGSATLFEGGSSPWRVLPADERRIVWRGPGGGMITAMIDLAGGRSICAFDEPSTQATHWVVCRIEAATGERDEPPGARYHLIDDPADIPVYGTSLAFLLNAALDSGGDIAHLETGRQDQLEELTELDREK